MSANIGSTSPWLKLWNALHVDVLGVFSPYNHPQYVLYLLYVLYVLYVMNVLNVF